MAAEEATPTTEPTTTATSIPLKPLPLLVPAASSASSPPPRPPVPGLFVEEGEGEDSGPAAPPRGGFKVRGVGF